MINSELIRNVVKSSSFYGVAFAFFGALGIFTYSIAHLDDPIAEKENGDHVLTVQLMAFAPQKVEEVAKILQQPKPEHKSKKFKKSKKQEIQAPLKQEPSNFQVKEEPIEVEVVEEVKQEVQEREVVELVQEKEVFEPAQEVATPQANTESQSVENIKTMRYADGVENEFLKAIRTAIQKRHDYPSLAKQRGYEGEVLVRFLISAEGFVSEIEIVSPSRYSVLNKAAIRTLRKASKDFPKPVEATYIEIPIAYVLERN